MPDPLTLEALLDAPDVSSLELYAPEPQPYSYYDRISHGGWLDVADPSHFLAVWSGQMAHDMTGLAVYADVALYRAVFAPNNGRDGLDYAFRGWEYLADFPTLPAARNAVERLCAAIVVLMGAAAERGDTFHMVRWTFQHARNRFDWRPRFADPPPGVA